MTLFRVRDVPIVLHPSFLLLVVGWTAWMGWSKGTEGLGVAAFWLAVFFVSVLVHELGHVVAAQMQDVPARSVVLLPIGGATRFEARRVRPMVDVWISFAGPLANLGLAAVGALVWAATDWRGALTFALINLLLGVGNLLPAFPMDGGRILRASLVRWLGFERGQAIALGVGVVFATTFVGLGIAYGQPGLVALALFMGLLQWREYRGRQALRAREGWS